MNDISIYVDGGGEGRMSLRPFLVVLVPSGGVSNVCEMKNNASSG